MNKQLKNDYRNKATNKEPGLPRVRRHGAPSLKEFAKTHDDGKKWRERKRRNGR